MLKAHGDMEPVEQLLRCPVVKIPGAKHILAAIGNHRQRCSVANSFLSEKSIQSSGRKACFFPHKTVAYTGTFRTDQARNRRTEPARSFFGSIIAPNVVRVQCD